MKNNWLKVQPLRDPRDGLLGLLVVHVARKTFRLRGTTVRAGLMSMGIVLSSPRSPQDSRAARTFSLSKAPQATAEAACISAAEKALDSSDFRYPPRVSVSEKSEANDWPPGICILKRTSGRRAAMLQPCVVASLGVRFSD